MDHFKRRLLGHGMFLFLLGLLTGLAEREFNNPRMGLAAHLEGVMNGLVLMVFGAISNEFVLSSRLRCAAYATALYGTYANWATTLMAAIFGTSALSPITGAAAPAGQWSEAIVTAGFTSVGLAMISSTAMLLWGLRRHSHAAALSPS
jgi:hydroxylaminobenzene mutase